MSNLAVRFRSILGKDKKPSRELNVFLHNNSFNKKKEIAINRIYSPFIEHRPLFSSENAYYTSNALSDTANPLESKLQLLNETKVMYNEKQNKQPDDTINSVTLNEVTLNEVTNGIIVPDNVLNRLVARYGFSPQPPPILALLIALLMSMFTMSGLEDAFREFGIQLGTVESYIIWMFVVAGYLFVPVLLYIATAILLLVYIGYKYNKNNDNTK